MDDVIKITIEYPGWIDQAAYVTRIGEGLYRLEADPLSFLNASSEEEIECLPMYHDVIEVSETASNVRRFIRVAERWRGRRFEFVISEDIVESPDLHQILSMVKKNGGDWERIFGGLLLIFIPDEVEFNPMDDLEKLGIRRMENG